MTQHTKRTHYSNKVSTVDRTRINITRHLSTMTF